MLEVEDLEACWNRWLDDGRDSEVRLERGVRGWDWLTSGSPRFEVGVISNVLRRWLEKDKERRKEGRVRFFMAASAT